MGSTVDTFDIKQAIGRALAREDLTADEMALVFGSIMTGDCTPAQIGGLLIGLRMKGETPDEIAGAARAMRERATPLRCPDPDTAVDTCGTGGDGSGSINVSTMAAIATAACGATVAKHGNRSLSSRSGSSDVLERLGVKVDAPVPVLERCLAEVGICFMFAPAFHAATRHAAGPRKELGHRTMFNLLGPITNPAGVRNQIIGVFDPAWCEPVATALGSLGARRVYVVHGEGGLDEIAVRGKTRVAEWDEARGTVVVSELSPVDFGLDEVDPAGLAGGDPDHNAAVARRIFAGEAGELAAGRNAVVMETAVALTATGVAGDFREGAARAAAALDEGAAAATLEKWAALSHEPAP